MVSSRLQLVEPDEKQSHRLSLLCDTVGNLKDKPSSLLSLLCDTILCPSVLKLPLGLTISYFSF